MRAPPAHLFAIYLLFSTKSPYPVRRLGWAWLINSFLREQWAQHFNNALITTHYYIQSLLRHHIILLGLLRSALNTFVSLYCRNPMMKRILFGCIGAGLAVGGAYFLYKRWQKYQQQCQQESNEVCDTWVNKRKVKREFRLEHPIRKGKVELRINSTEKPKSRDINGPWAYCRLRTFKRRAR